MRIPYLREAGAVILLALLAWGGHGLYKAGANSERVRAEKVIAEFAKAEADAQAKARKAEQALAEGIAKADAKHQQELADAKASRDRTIAGLRSGAIKLRDEWAGCETDRLSSAATGAIGPDDAAERRISGTGRVLEAVDDDAAKIRGLQDILRAERGR